jgi:hypothetical protein
MATESVEVSAPIIAKETYTWTLEAFEKQGRLWLQWTTTAPFRAQDGQITVYSQGFPANPENNRVVWKWDDQWSPDGWDTLLVYGTDWYCAWIGGATGKPYQYIVKLITRRG